MAKKAKKGKARTSQKPRASAEKDAQNEREQTSSNSSTVPGPTEEALRDRLAKAEMVVFDKSAPVGQRNAARTAARGLRKQIGALVVQGDPKYHDLVKRGKIAAKSLWILGDLAAQIEGEYGKDRLGQYAEDIGVPYETLKAARSTVRAWPDEKGRRLSFSASQAMNALPDRFKIAEKRPGLTVAQAREMASAHRDSMRRDETEEQPREGRRMSMLERSARSLMARLVDLVDPLTELNDEDLTELKPDVRDELRALIAGVRNQMEKLLDELENISTDAIAGEERIGGVQ
jgi:hypothetical protein